MDHASLSPVGRTLKIRRTTFLSISKPKS